MQNQIVTNNSATQVLTQVDSLVGTHLEAAERAFWKELDSQRPFIREVLKHLSGYRGKRLRPMLLLLTARACGTINEHHHTLAAVVEMIHTATLVHDDVLDEATMRRHVATINSRWSNETSVMLGDYLFTHAFHLTAGTGSADACRLIGRATNLVCEGEMAQIAERGNLNLTEEQYLDIIEGKTAELCAVACYLGAHFAQENAHVSQAMEQYGRCLGIAFQIADDVLDVVGAEQVTGKSLGSDLEKQKLTLPVIYALSQLTGDRKQELLTLLDSVDRTARDRILPYLEMTAAIDYARSRAQEYILLARHQLGVLADSPAKTVLEEIADFVTQRSN